MEKGGKIKKGRRADGRRALHSPRRVAHVSRGAAKGTCNWLTILDGHLQHMQHEM